MELGQAETGATGSLSHQLPALGGESVAVLLASGSLSHHAITVSLAEYHRERCRCAAGEIKIPLRRAFGWRRGLRLR